MRTHILFVTNPRTADPHRRSRTIVLACAVVVASVVAAFGVLGVPSGASAFRLARIRNPNELGSGSDPRR